MNRSFSTVNPRLQLAWDSHSLTTFKECPRKYYYSIILGLQPKKTATDLQFGILYARGKEHYHKARQNDDHETALLKTVRQALIDSVGDWGDNIKNRQTLIRTIIWSLEQYKEDYLQTYYMADGTPAIELHFSLDTGQRAYTDEPYVLCGIIDRIAHQGDDLVILDDKTTRSTISGEYFERYSPHNQMSQYTFGGQVILNKRLAGVLIDAAQIAVNFSRFTRGMTHRTKAQVEEWYNGAIWWIKLAERCAADSKAFGPDESPSLAWPLNESSCFLCGFKSICSKDPAVRNDFLHSNFVERKWDPLSGRA